MTEDEKKGYALFKQHGCVSCHRGVNIGGDLYERLGVMGDYFADRGNVTEADFGRYNVTGRERDRFKFKVPSLRNVEVTAPYFHDGSVDSLEDAVQTMVRYQIGEELPDADVVHLVQFLKTLTGEFDGARLTDN